MNKELLPSVPPGVASWLHREEGAAVSGFSQSSCGSRPGLGAHASHWAWPPHVSGGGLCHHPVADSVGLPSISHREAMPQGPRGSPLRMAPPRPRDNCPALAGGPRPCRLTLRASPSLRPCLPSARTAWPLPELLLLWPARLIGAQASPSTPGSESCSLRWAPRTAQPMPGTLRLRALLSGHIWFSESSLPHPRSREMADFTGRRHSTSSASASTSAEGES